MKGTRDRHVKVTVKYLEAAAHVWSRGHRAAGNTPRCHRVTDAQANAGGAIYCVSYPHQFTGDSVLSAVSHDENQNLPRSNFLSVLVRYLQVDP
jgi:hypothetical protein